MNRLFFAFMLLAAVVAMAALFQVKHEVQQKERRLEALNEQILRDQESIHILKAEWSYLNDPKRLARLAERHLDLKPMETAQVSQVAYLPPRPEDFGFSREEKANQKPYPRSRPRAPEDWSPEPLPRLPNKLLQQVASQEAESGGAGKQEAASDEQASSKLRAASASSQTSTQPSPAASTSAARHESGPVNPVTGRPLPTGDAAAKPTFISMEVSQ
ncbi:MAG: cell division protein FtsL [Pseudomonadota bacterium]